MGSFRRHIVNTCVESGQEKFYQVTLTAINGTIIGASSGIYVEGTELTFTAVPNEGYVFINWSDGNTSQTRTIIVTSNVTLSCSFDKWVTNLLKESKLTNWTFGNIVSGSASENNLGWNGVSETFPGLYIEYSSSVVECYYFSKDNIYLNPAHTYYVRIHMIHNCWQYPGVINYDVYWPLAEPKVLGTSYPSSTGWNKYSQIFTRESFTEGDYALRIDVNNRNKAAAANMSCAMLIDLTETYGTNIPSKAVLDSKPYFCGLKKLSEW